MGLLSKLQSRLELHRLEKKYTTRRRSGPSSSPPAQYIDGEYIYQSPTSTSSHSANCPHQIPHLTSSSSAFAATQQQTSPASPAAVSFTPSPPWTTAHTGIGSGSGPTKHSSWQSFTPSSLAGSGNSSSARNSTLTAAESPMLAISRNSKGQNWEPPKQGWGGDGTDAFKGDKKEFRFDVERDRRSVGRG